MKEARFCERRGDGLAIVQLMIPECASDILTLDNLEKQINGADTRKLYNRLLQQISEVTAE